MTTESPAAAAASGVTLRTAVPADRDVVIDLIQALNQFENRITGDRLGDRDAAAAYYAVLLERLPTMRGRLVLAIRNGVAVGLMGFGIREDEVFVEQTSRTHGYVTDLVVAEEAREQGIGRLLLAEGERLTREAGSRRYCISVLAGNIGAAAAYRTYGFADYACTLVKALD